MDGLDSPFLWTQKNCNKWRYLSIENSVTHPEQLPLRHSLSCSGRNSPRQCQDAETVSVNAWQTAEKVQLQMAGCSNSLLQLQNAKKVCFGCWMLKQSASVAGWWKSLLQLQYAETVCFSCRMMKKSASVAVCWNSLLQLQVAETVCFSCRMLKQSASVAGCWNSLLQLHKKSASAAESWKCLLQ